MRLAEERDSAHYDDEMVHLRKAEDLAHAGKNQNLKYQLSSMQPQK
jgi:hypothetical protein